MYTSNKILEQTALILLFIMSLTSAESNFIIYEAYSESKYRLQIFPLQRSGCRFAHVH
jgi:hypothetical protein